MPAANKAPKKLKKNIQKMVDVIAAGICSSVRRGGEPAVQKDSGLPSESTGARNMSLLRKRDRTAEKHGVLWLKMSHPAMSMGFSEISCCGGTDILGSGKHYHRKQTKLVFALLPPG